MPYIEQTASGHWPLPDVGARVVGPQRRQMADLRVAAVRQAVCHLLLQLRPQAVRPLVDGVLQAVHLVAVQRLQGQDADYSDLDLHPVPQGTRMTDHPPRHSPAPAGCFLSTLHSCILTLWFTGISCQLETPQTDSEELRTVGDWQALTGTSSGVVILTPALIHRTNETCGLTL